MQETGFSGVDNGEKHLQTFEEDNGIYSGIYSWPMLTASNAVPIYNILK